MKLLLRAVACGVCLVLLGGCKRGMCEREGAPLLPISPQWAARSDLTPPGAKVCGMTSDGTALDVDYVDANDAFADLTRHLEGEGYTRTSQQILDADIATATFRKGGSKDEVFTHTVRVRGRWHTSFNVLTH